MTTSPTSTVDAITGSVLALTPDAPPAARVGLGQPIRCRTEDASGGQMSEQVRPADLVPARMFPVVGPIAVDGIAAGDAVGIAIRAIRPVPFGHTWTRPGLGFAAPVEFAVRRLSTERPVIDWGGGLPIDVPPRLHIGAIGVLPDSPQATRTLGPYGGNLDSVLCRPGCVAWFTAQVDGGGVFLGDVHLAMGDAEVCGTGIEAAAEVDLAIRRSRAWAPRLPTMVVDGRAWLVSVGESIEDALALAVEECVRAVSLQYGMTPADAYLTVGLLLEVTLCQVVNPRRSVAVSLRGGADVALAPKEARA